jgi:hypothetical protein
VRERQVCLLKRPQQTNRSDCQFSYRLQYSGVRSEFLLLFIGHWRRPANVIVLRFVLVWSLRNGLLVLAGMSGEHQASTSAFSRRGSFPAIRHISFVYEFHEVSAVSSCPNRATGRASPSSRSWPANSFSSAIISGSCVVANQLTPSDCHFSDTSDFVLTAASDFHQNMAS